MKNRTKATIFKGSALALDVGAPLIATLMQFPLWIEQSAEATMSGLCLMFILISCLPFIKQIKELFKSPSSWLMFTIMFVIFTMLRNIIDQIVVVSFVGMVANILGAGIYNIGKRFDEREEKKEDKT